MTRTVIRGALTLCAVAGILSCSENPSSLRPAALPQSNPVPRAAVLSGTPQLVISQIYGGGGNSGATIKNDFIEIFNPGGTAVSLTGWSVQYASAAGSTWQKTSLTGTVPAGGYHLVREAAGTGGTVSLVPDDTGSIPMSATAGKVALVSNTTTLSGICPAGIINVVSFGTTASNCGAKTTPTLSNTTAALRKDLGCAFTANDSLDFAVAAPAPRNSATPVSVCPGQLPLGPLHHVVVTGPSVVVVGNTIQLLALAQDSNNQVVPTATVTWASSNEAAATVDQTGKVRGVAANPTPVTITATATDNGITRSGTAPVTVQAPGIGWIDVSSSATSFPPGFQTQLFATARVSNGGDTISANFTFESLDPGIATVAPVGNSAIITGASVSTTKPRIKVTATPKAGGAPYSFTAQPVTIVAGDSAPASIYAKNDEFGDPATGNAADVMIVRPQYTISYSTTRGTPNWVSYELDAGQFGPQDRCNCFTADPLLPTAAQILTSDYTNGGFDRGHMTRSADRTYAELDNARTFYLTNIVPQQADLNQGPWEAFESALGDSARAGRAVYIVTGPLYSKSHGLTFLKNEGKVAIPDSTWKIVLVGPRSGTVPFTRARLSTWSWDSLASVTVLAVNMPNVAGIKTVPWTQYLTTVDRIEQATGYNLLDLLRADFQDALEAGDRPPVPGFTVGTPRNEGDSITFDASTTSDPDMSRTDLGRTEALTYTWNFSDGSLAYGRVIKHVFADNAAYSAKLTVTDAFGWEKSLKQIVNVANVAPSVTLQATTPVTIHSGDTVAVAGSFTDPGPDAPWKAVLNWGNGSDSSSINAVGTPILGSRKYLTIGSYTVTLTVTDKDGGAGSATVGVNVGRLPVTGVALPKSIALDETDGAIKVTLYSQPGADVTTLDLSTVRVGSATVADRKVKVVAEGKKSGQIVLRFDRQALLDAGVLTPETTELVVTGDLANGVEITSAVPVEVH